MALKKNFGEIRQNRLQSRKPPTPSVDKQHDLTGLELTLW